MPLYEYACKACAHEFETLVTGGQTPECPACHATTLERKLSAFAARVGHNSPMKYAEPKMGACGTCGDPRGPGACSIN